MHRLIPLLALAFLTGCSAPVSTTKTQPTHTAAPASLRSNADILTAYATAWLGEKEFHLKNPYIISFQIDTEEYAIELTNSGAAITTGKPDSFNWAFKTDRSTLLAIDQGRMNALTAMGQARASDPIPLQYEVPEDIEFESIRSYDIPLLLHFWNRAWPESIPFGDGATRLVHGGNTTVLVYDEGIRSAWYQLNPNMHINQDPVDQINDFDAAIIVTRGRFSGKLDGALRTFSEGEAVIIPEGMAHEFFTRDSQYGEFILMMWGPNA